MQLQLSLAGLETGPHIEEIIDSKLEKHLNKFLNKYDNLVLFVHIQKDHDGTHTVSSHADLPGPGGHIMATHSDNDLVVATKRVASQLEKQILRFRDK